MSEREKILGAAIDAAPHFAFASPPVQVDFFGTGLINNTFLVSTRTTRYLLQKINTNVFRYPQLVMANIELVTKELRNKLHSENIPSSELTQRVLTIIPCIDGNNFYIDAENNFWRSYLFIENSYSVEVVTSTEQAYTLGAAIGNFQRLLVDLDYHLLGETIPNFHNSPVRYADFVNAVQLDKAGRAKSVQAEIDYFYSACTDLGQVTQSMQTGATRKIVTHNDAKIANLLFNKVTHEAICVVDLDTCMPGSPAYDLGDLVRTIAASTAEDDPDCNKMHFVFERFVALLQGYARGSKNKANSSFLHSAEIELLATGIKTIILEQGLRFLSDYLNGDIYYQIKNPDHNLWRTRTQIKLCQSLQNQWDQVRLAIDTEFGL